MVVEHGAYTRSSGRGRAMGESPETPEVVHSFFLPSLPGSQEGREHLASSHPPGPCSSTKSVFLA